MALIDAAKLTEFRDDQADRLLLAHSMGAWAEDSVQEAFRALQLTLAVVHASLNSQRHLLQGLAEFPFPIMDGSMVSISQTAIAEPSALTGRPSLSSCRQWSFSSLEESR